MSVRVIEFDEATGEAHAMWCDDLGLTDLGDVSNTRVSRVTWSEENQQWVARRLSDDSVIACGIDRDTVVEAEIQVFQEERLRQPPPTDVGGLQEPGVDQLESKGG